MVKHSHAIKYYATAAGAVFTALAIILSLRLILKHRSIINGPSPLRNPKEQWKIIYILAMTPLFAISSFVGLIEWDANETFIMCLDSVKECYEAWVILSFLTLMYSLAGISLSKKTIPPNLAKKHIHQIAPLSWFLSDWPVNTSTLSNLRMWCVQFILLRPILSIISVYLESVERYEEFSMYFSVALNISVTLAVYALMMFYHTFEEELASQRPLAKFLCIKGVVFFAFWQGVIVQGLVYYGIIHQGKWYSVEELSTFIQNFLVCFEMGLIFTFANAYAFSIEPYLQKPKSN